MSVAATDKETGREQQMRITPTSGLSPDEIEKIIHEAETAAESDREARDRIGLQNKLESLVKNTQRTFVEFGGLLSANDQELGQRALKEGEAAAHSQELGEIKLALDTLERLARDLTNAMLKGTGEPSPPAEDEEEN